MDAEITAWAASGPLRGVPRGAKDVLAVKDYRTTWSAAPYQQRMIGYDAIVVEWLENGAAILLAKSDSARPHAETCGSGATLGIHGVSRWAPTDPG